MVTDQLTLALNIASNAHLGQEDKSGTPYIMHCLTVMGLVKSMIGKDDYELLAIAILHDTVEDSDHTLEILRKLGVSERVISAVDCLTKRAGESYDEYIARVISNVDAVIVKMCDITHNMDVRRLKGLRQKDFDRVVKYQKTYKKLEKVLEQHSV